jgi:predicted 3-demethylubiquinone-9 3-methyltransferase (glyoxalase superfamily)
METQKMKICLWFDSQAEEAAKFYTGIFKDSRIIQTTRYGKEGFEIHGQKEGTAMVVTFRLNELEFMALNGGPKFTFNESISVVVLCQRQDEIDHYWEKLTEGGKESQCGWLKDKYGVSWQIVPAGLDDLMKNSKNIDRLMKAFLPMKKFDIEKLRQAANG